MNTEATMTDEQARAAIRATETEIYRLTRRIEELKLGLPPFEVGQQVTAGGLYGVGTVSDIDRLERSGEWIAYVTYSSADAVFTYPASKLKPWSPWTRPADNADDSDDDEEESPFAVGQRVRTLRPLRRGVGRVVDIDRLGRLREWVVFVRFGTGRVEAQGEGNARTYAYMAHSLESAEAE